MAAKRWRNYYSILKLAPGASAGEVKQAYRRLAFVYHPDRAGAEGAKRFMLVKEARDTLADPSRRAAYDRELALRGNGTSRGGAPACHDMSFVREYIRKNRDDLHRKSRRKTEPAFERCVLCGGRGMSRDIFGGTRSCRWCKGSGVKRRGAAR